MSVSGSDTEGGNKLSCQLGNVQEKLTNYGKGCKERINRKKHLNTIKEHELFEVHSIRKITKTRREL